MYLSYVGTYVYCRNVEWKGVPLLNLSHVFDILCKCKWNSSHTSSNWLPYFWSSDRKRCKGIQCGCCSRFTWYNWGERGRGEVESAHPLVLLPWLCTGWTLFMTIIQKLFGLYFFKIIASPDLCFTYPCKCLCIIYLLSFYLSIGVNELIVDTCDSTVHICLQTPRTILLYHSIVEICIYVIFFYWC